MEYLHLFGQDSGAKVDRHGNAVVSFSEMMAALLRCLASTKCQLVFVIYLFIEGEATGETGFIAVDEEVT